jgi:hypothetical protein
MRLAVVHLPASTEGQGRNGCSPWPLGPWPPTDHDADPAQAASRHGLGADQVSGVRSLTAPAEGISTHRMG